MLPSLSMFLALIVFGLILSACQPLVAPETLTPEEMVLAAADGWNESEVTVAAIDATLAHFDEDAVYELVGLPTGVETYSGHGEIYAWMEGLLEGGFRLTADILESEGTSVTTETKTWMNWSRDAGIAPLVAIEEYTVEGGKITRVTWTLTQESLEQLLTVMGE